MSRVREIGMEDRILDSAFSVFGELGFQAKTVKEIAQAAGISSGSVYTYFSDKESLFKAAVNRGWAAFIDELETINHGRFFHDERIAILLDRGFSILGAALPLIRGMLFEASKHNLLEPNVERLCVAIGEILKPDEGSPLLDSWDAATSDRLILTRVVILGILSSAALLPPPSPESAIDGLKDAIRALLAATGMLLPVEVRP